MIALDLPGTRNGIIDCKGRDGFLIKTQDSLKIKENGQTLPCLLQGGFHKKNFLNLENTFSVFLKSDIYLLKTQTILETNLCKGVPPPHS